MNTTQIIAILVFLLAISLLVTDKLHRATVAITGGVALLLLKVLTVEEAIDYIDFNTIGVLVGMMIFVGVVKYSGLFEYVSIRTAKIARGKPWRIMLLFTIVTACLSAFLDNVTTVLLVGPMVISICRILDLDPVPFLMTQIVASNIGGTATLIGDPPNIMIGSEAGLSFVDFLLNTGPAVVLIMVAVLIMLWIAYGRKFHISKEAQMQIMLLDEEKTIVDKKLMHKSIIVMILLAVGFLTHSSLGLESSAIALAGAAVMLLIGKQNVDEIIAEVEWTTIVFFTGLFVIVGGLVKTGIIDMLSHDMIELTHGSPILMMLLLLWGSAILSSFLDNIPFVAALIPMILAMESQGVNVTPLWWAISLGACLGGNGTLIGASANVVLSGISGRQGHPITFHRFLKVGMPVMILSVIISTFYLLVRYAI